MRGQRNFMENLMYSEKYFGGLTEEYQLLVERAARATGVDANPLDTLKRMLQDEADWTGRGAEALLRLAQDYGAFMLRNALALAVTMGIEDGKKAF